MARVSYSWYSDYAARSASVVNTAWTAFQTQSTNVGADNVRDEGLDQRNLASACATDGYDLKGYDGNPEALVPAGAYPTYSDLAFTAGPTTINVTNGGSGWAVGAGVGRVRVRFAAQCQWDNGVRGAFTSDSLYFRLRYTSNLGTTDVTVTEVLSQGYGQVSDVIAAPTGCLRYFRDATAFCYLIPNTLNMTSVSDIRVRFATTSGGAVTVGHCELEAVRFVNAV